VSRASRAERKRAEEPAASRARSAPRVETRASREALETRRPRRRTFRVARFTVVVVLVLATLGVVGEWVLRQSYFRVQHVTFVGVRHEPLSLVLAASGLEAHPTMLDVNASTVKANLAQFAWIDAVHLTKHWPNTVVVTVHESTAVAVAFNNRHVLQYVDRDGRDLGVAPLHVNLPTLRYLHPRDATWPYARAGRSAAYVAAQLPPAFSAQVSIVTEDDHGVVTLRMTTPVTFILGPATQLHAKFVAIASVIATSTLRPGDVVDATVPGELAVTGGAPT
jgi:cell division protein FtsQ